MRCARAGRGALGCGVAACLAALLLPACAMAEPRLRELSNLVWRDSRSDFGGFSGLEVSADGTSLVTVSDRGHYATATLTREAGIAVGISLVRFGPLRDPDGRPVRRFDVDAEGLTLGADGRLHVSFEANHRVWAYGDLDGPADPMPQIPDYDRLQNNSSLEALFTGPDGSIRTIPERSGRLTRPFPVYALKSGRWGFAGTIPRSGAWLVTGADLGPDGRLYLVERDFQGLLGFATRIRRFAVTGSGQEDAQILLATGPGRYGNLEGISAWRDAAGQVRLTLIADDNFSFFQQTRLVEFAVED